MFDDILKLRKGSTMQWHATDKEESYSPLQPDGSFNYSTTNIDYKFNSDGFRCDEFTDPSDLPITFIGCSFTEGIGLPLDQCWPKMLISMIKSQPKFAQASIPHHSIALSGTGIDSAAYFLPNAALVTKPKYIIGFFNSVYRRDYCVTDTHIRHWIYHDADDLYFRKEINRLFSDRYFALHQTYRSLQTIDLVAQLHNATAYIMIANNDEVKIPSSMFRSTKIEYCSISKELSPAHLSTALRLARDNQHPGANWQFTVATLIADAVLPDISDSYQRVMPTSAIQSVVKPNPSAVTVLKSLVTPNWLTGR